MARTPQKVDGRTVTVAEASELTGLSKGALRARLDRGRLPYSMGDDGLRYIPLAELQHRGLLQRMPADPPPKGTRIAEIADRVEQLGRELDTLAAELRVELRDL